MAKKFWMAQALYNQIKHEDEKTANLMKRVGDSLSKCSSRTIFDVSWNNYNRLCKKDISNGDDFTKRKKPETKEFFGFKGGKDSKSYLSTLGLAKCNKIQCPLCCYARSYIRRNAALAWAKNVNWREYYAVSLTFTVPHKLFDSKNINNFKKLLSLLTQSLRSFSQCIANISNTSRSGYTSACIDSLGFISSFECTFGKNGLHPHFHTIFFTKSERDVKKLRDWFRKDRVKIWKKSGGNLLRMPQINEDKSFQVLVSPNENSGPEKILSYINKGLFETISVDKKIETWAKTSKNIFNLTGSELKYFCIFYEATKGMRFYRSGGVCKEIKGISKHIKDWKESSPDDIVTKKMDEIVKIENKKKEIPDGEISIWVQQFQSILIKKAINLSAEAIKKMVENSWNDYVEFYKKIERKKKEYFNSFFNDCQKNIL